MAKKTRRKFHLPDVEFMHEARIKSNFFKKDRADFISFDADFSDPFYDQLALLIDEVYSEDDNKTLVAVQTQLEKIVEENMQRCREKFLDAKHYIEKAFPNNLAVWEAFGYKRYSKIRRSRLGLDGFMKTFYGFAVKYSAQLIAKNYTQAMIDEIKTLQEALIESVCDHESFITSRSTAARDRIIKMNQLYDLIMQVCRAGKRIYKNDWAMYQKYLFKHFKKEKKNKLKAAA